MGLPKVIGQELLDALVDETLRILKEKPKGSLSWVALWEAMNPPGRFTVQVSSSNVLMFQGFA